MFLRIFSVLDLHAYILCRFLTDIFINELYMRKMGAGEVSYFETMIHGVYKSE